jgi:catechol 2,3-dioxygenase-like lactoylglutathione lyase family enzyme
MEANVSSVEQSRAATDTAEPDTTDLKLEVVVIPVSDVDRAKAFYQGLGWRLDADFADGQGFRIVQFTPPGVGVLDPVRLEGDVRAARLGHGHVPGGAGRPGGA